MRKIPLIKVVFRFFYVEIILLLWYYCSASKAIKEPTHMAYFVKRSNYKKGTYLQIYFSYRDPETGNPKNKCHKTYGYESDLIAKGDPNPIATITAEVERLNEEWKHEKEAKKSKKIDKVTPERHIGYLPLEKIARRMEVEEPLNLMATGRRFEFDFASTLLALSYARAIHPCSKKKTVEKTLPTLYNAPQISYDQALSCLDFAGHRYSKIIEVLTRQLRETYDLDTNTTYFDGTNFYFEIDEEDNLRRKGPSKERRTDPIIGMGLLLDKNCIPIGMELFPGNESEKPVLRSTIHRLKEQQDIHSKTIQVADKGLNCAQNIIAALGEGDGYLLSKSVKSLKEKDREWTLNTAGFTDVLEEDNKTVSFMIKSRIVPVEYKYQDENKRWHRVKTNEKQIVSYNPSLARKQRREIKKQVRKAETLSASAAKKSEFGDCAKYVDFKSVESTTGEITDEGVAAVINEEKVKKDLSCAGYNMLVTSELEASPMEVYKKYHELWRIEETFRTMKSQLDARPVYLRDEYRIYGHFLVCYIAVLLIRIFQFKTMKNKFGTEEICEFIRTTKLLPIDKYKAVNLSPDSDVIEYIDDTFHIPLMKYSLNKTDIKKILDCNF